MAMGCGDGVWTGDLDQDGLGAMQEAGQKRRSCESGGRPDAGAGAGGGARLVTWATDRPPCGRRWPPPHGSALLWVPCIPEHGARGHGPAPGGCGAVSVVGQGDVGAPARLARGPYLRGTPGASRVREGATGGSGASARGTRGAESESDAKHRAREALAANNVDVAFDT